MHNKKDEGKLLKFTTEAQNVKPSQSFGDSFGKRTKVHKNNNADHASC